MNKPYPENILYDIFNDNSYANPINKTESFDEILAFVKTDVENTIDSAINLLRDTVRDRVFKRYKEGKSYSEIGKKYGVNPSAIKCSIIEAIYDLRKPKMFNIIKYGATFKDREITLDDELIVVLSDSFYRIAYYLRHSGIKTIKDLLNFGIPKIKTLHLGIGKIKFQRILQELRDLNIEELNAEIDKYLRVEYPKNLLIDTFNLKTADKIMNKVPDLDQTIHYLFSLKLEPEYKKIIHYYYKQEHSFNEIRVMMNCKQEFIDKAIKNGQSELRKNKELISKGIAKCLSDIIK